MATSSLPAVSESTNSNSRMTSAQIIQAAEREAERLKNVAREKRARAQILWDEADEMDREVNRLHMAVDSLGSTAIPVN